MSARLTPLTVAERQLDAWRQKHQRLTDQLAEIESNIDRWETIRAGLVGDSHEAAVEPEPAEAVV